MQLFGKRGIKSDLPGMYLMEALFEVGPSRFDGNGEYAILWQELLAYATVTGSLSEHWELRTVMNMSKAYVAEKAGGTDPFRIAPVDREAMNG